MVQSPLKFSLPETNNLYIYLQERPGITIDVLKIQRHLGINNRILLNSFSELHLLNIGTLLYPFSHSQFLPTQTNHQKFYFFDESYLLENSNYRTDQSGALFEQLVFSKLYSLVNNIWFMRTKDGIEVDFIIRTKKNQYFAIELQKDQFIYASDLQGLHFFNKEFSLTEKLFVLHMGERENKEGAVLIMPHGKFISMLSHS